MIPEISEFSYGFALTNELVGWVELRAAPIFPSLLEEGKIGGGYDVMLDLPGAPLYLQFKRSEYMMRRSAREYRSIHAHGGWIDVPFYRFLITEAAKSDQHELLLALDTTPNHVFYVAPRFHRLSEINDAWHVGAVASRSVFVSPSEIGPLDDERHTVAFDGSASWVCSDPRPMRALSSREMLEKLQAALQEDTRPLRARLPDIVEGLRDAEQRGYERIFEKRREESKYTPQGPRRFEALEPTPPEPISPEPTPPITREPKLLGPERQALRDASDIAFQVFDAQFIIVQPVK